MISKIAKDSSLEAFHFVLIRGLTRGNIHWQDFYPQLQSRFPKSEFTLLELAGNGNRTEEASWSTVLEACEDLRAQLAASSIKKPLVLVAISLGGMVALEWLARYPEEIQKAFILNTSSRLSSFFSRLRPKNYLPMAQALSTKNPFRRESLILDMTTRTLSFQRQQELAEIFAKVPPTTIGNFFKQASSAARYQPPDRLPADKLHFLVGVQDELVDSQCSKHLIEKYQASSSWHPEAGHDLGLDAPNWLCDEIASCLKSEPKSS